MKDLTMGKHSLTHWWLVIMTTNKHFFLVHKTGIKDREMVELCASLEEANKLAIWDFGESDLNKAKLNMVEVL